MEIVPVVKDIEVSPPWADLIFNGTKKVEVRKNDPNNWGATKEGDLLRVIKKGTTESKAFRVVAVRTYPNLDDCLTTEGVSNLLPGFSTMQQGRVVYLGFDGPEKQDARWQEFAKFGAIAIQIEPIERKLSSEKTTPRNNVIVVPPSTNYAWIKYTFEDSTIDVKIDLPAGVKTVQIIFDPSSNNSGGDMVASRYSHTGSIQPKQNRSYLADDLKRISQDYEDLVKFRAVTKAVNEALGETPKKLLQTHIRGSSNPKGHPDCTHRLLDGKSCIEYNDDTMGGCGSGWHRMCNFCGKVWQEDE